MLTERSFSGKPEGLSFFRRSVPFFRAVVNVSVAVKGT
jgi:hypothetical protein